MLVQEREMEIYFKSFESIWYMCSFKSDSMMPEFKGEYFSMYGWIDVDGSWYSCGFGGHSAKAMIIIEHSFENRFKEYTEKMRTRNNIEDSFLESIGWVKFHNPHSNKEPYAELYGNRRLLFDQKNRIIDIQKQFNLGVFNNIFDIEQNEDRW